MEINSELSKIASDLQNPIDGKTLNQARKIVGDIMHKSMTKKLYSDEYWQGPNEVMKGLSAKGIDWELVKAEYSPDMKTKTWKITVNFQNDKDVLKTLNGSITAFAAGSVKDPFDKYDVVAQIF